MTNLSLGPKFYGNFRYHQCYIVTNVEFLSGEEELQEIFAFERAL